MLRLQIYTAASEFLGAVQAYLEKQEVVNGLMLGLAGTLAGNPLAFGSLPYLATVVDEQGPVLAALMTPPHNLLLSSEQASASEAMELMARDLIEHHWLVAGVHGPAGGAETFASVWTGLTGVSSKPGMSQRIYELRQVIQPRYSPGSLRLAVEDHTELVLQWTNAFQQEALPTSPPTPPDMIEQRIAERTVYLWEHDGPVSMAIKMRPTRHGMSIGWVYTPPERRRRGYAASCVAALSQQILDGGCRFCTLFTDMTNPTSNDIYQQIGYRPVCDTQEIKFIQRS